MSASHRPTHALTLHAIRDLFAGGKAAGAFDVEDPEATAVLCWASTHDVDPGFHGQPGQPVPGSSARAGSYSAGRPAVTSDRRWLDAAVSRGMAGAGRPRARLRFEGGELVVHLTRRGDLVEVLVDVVASAADVLEHAGLQ